MTQLSVLSGKLAARFGLESGEQELLATLKQTAFKGQVSDAQMTALLIVAGQYGLNPFTKEIYAFPDRHNGIVPVVGVDGWSRIINENPQFDGLDFEQDGESCTCIIYRKDRKHPIKVTEWMAECKREGTGPWQSHPRRMLRHKALIQCARLAFGYVGLYDEDEAERIIERDITPPRTESAARHELPAYPQDDFDANLPKWLARIEAGKATADEIIRLVSTKGTLTEVQKNAIRGKQEPKGEVLDAEPQQQEQQA